MSPDDVIDHIKDKCGDKTEKELKQWHEKIANNPDSKMDLSVAKLKVGKEISAGEYKNLQENRAQFLIDFPLDPIETPKFVIKNGKIEEGITITYQLEHSFAETFDVPELTEQAGIKFASGVTVDQRAQLIAFEATIADEKTEFGDYRVAVQGIKALEAEIEQALGVNAKLFNTKTAILNSEMGANEYRYRKCKAVVTFDKFKLEAIEVVLGRMLMEKQKARALKVAQSWMNEDGLRAAGFIE